MQKGTVCSLPARAQMSPFPFTLTELQCRPRGVSRHFPKIDVNKTPTVHAHFYLKKTYTALEWCSH